MLSVSLLLGLSAVTMLAAAQNADSSQQDSATDVPGSKDTTPSVINAMNASGTASTSMTRNRMPAKSDLSPEFVDQCLDVAEEIDPEFAKQLRSLCEVDPVEFERIIRRQGPRLTGLAELKSSDPQLFQLKVIELNVDAAVQRLASELRSLKRESPENVDEIAQLTNQLQGQLQIRLGLQLGNQMLYIDRMQEQLQILRDQVEAQRSNFDSVVARELDLLTGRLDPVQAATGRQKPTGASAPAIPGIPFPYAP